MGCNFDTKREDHTLTNNRSCTNFYTGGEKTAVMHSGSCMYYHIVPEIRASDLCSFHDFAITPNNAVADSGISGYLSASAYHNIPNDAALCQFHAIL